MSFTEWAVEGGIDHDTRRQQKNRRRYDGADSHYRRRRAGGWAAKTLRDEGFSGEICVVAEEQWDFYERPPLSKAALLEAEPALPRLFSAEVQQALDLRWYRPLRAKSIDRQNKTGAEQRRNAGVRPTADRHRRRARCRPRPGQHPQVYTLRHWQDAQRLKQRWHRQRGWRSSAAAGLASKSPPRRAKAA